MKIRTQFSWLISMLIVIPITCIISLPLYHFFSSPQRYLMKGYREIRTLGYLDLSENDWDAMRDEIKKIPPNVQVAVYCDFQIIISNIPELRPGTSLLPTELFSFIKESSSDYDYQFHSPEMNSGKRRTSVSSYLMISRAKVPGRRATYRNRLYVSAFIVFALFEVTIITIVIQLSRTIYSSISMLEKNTQKIADGELDIQLEQPKLKREANEITSLSESLDRMRIALKDNQERRTKFIMGISHDLRTPVALIKGYTEAITDGVVTDMDSVKKSLAIVETKADQLESMINDLINYMKLNTTEWQQSLEISPLKPLLRDFADSAMATGDVYNRRISAIVDIADDIQVPMDKNLVNRALENIFSNAVRYSKDGDAISIKCTQETDFVIISISDSGVGISEKDLEHIFDIFYRSSTSRREQGLGIGLSVVKTIIETHGWKVDVDSELGKGTSFFITVPLKNLQIPRS